MDYMDRQSGKVYVEFILASVLLLSVVIVGFSFIGDTVNDHVDGITTALIQDPERSQDGQVVVTDEFLNQLGPTAAGSQQNTPQSFINVQPDGSIRIVVSPENMLRGAAIFACLVLSLILFRLAFRG